MLDAHTPRSFETQVKYIARAANNGFSLSNYERQFILSMMTIISNGLKPTRGQRNCLNSLYKEFKLALRTMGIKINASKGTENSAGAIPAPANTSGGGSMRQHRRKCARSEEHTSELQS